LFPFLKGNIKESISESFAELIKLLWLVYLLDGLHEELKTKTNYQTSFKEIIVPNNKIDAEFQVRIFG